MNKKIGIIIVNYNGGKQIIKCLSSLAKHDYLKKVILVDNASLDDSLKAINNLFPRVTVIKNSKNFGFAKGSNIGIRYALSNKAKNILLLNSDTILSKNDVEKLVKNNGDIVGPILKFRRSNRLYFDLGGYIDWNIGRSFHKEANSISRINNSNPDYVSGAVMLIRKKVIDKIGFFDEKYFLYYEDVDYCVRARKADFKIAIDTNTIIHHELSSTLGRKSPITLYHNLRSNLIFILKHISLTRKTFALAYWVFLCGKVILNWFLHK